MSRFSFRETIKKNKQGATLALLLFISTISILFSGSSLIKSPAQLGLSILSVFGNVFTGIGNFVSGTINSVHELGELRTKYKELSERLESYRGVERLLVELQKENQELRNQLNFKEQSSFRLIPAQIVGKDPSNVSRVILINKGHLDGVRPDAPVIAYQGNDYGLVGRILETGFTGAQIQTVTDPGNYVASRFLNNRYEGMVVGQGGVNDILRLLYVRKRAREEIRFGDLVVTSGNNSLYPRGLSLGRVSQIYSRDYDNTLEIELEPVVNFATLEHVFVLAMDEEVNQ